MANVADVRREMTKTKEQLEEEKKISLSIRIRPLELDGMDIDSLKEKGKELWEQIVKLETEKYDLEEKVKRQDYDVRLEYINDDLLIKNITVERVEGETKAAEQTESNQAWSRPRVRKYFNCLLFIVKFAYQSSDWQVSTQDQDVLQV